MAKVKPKTLILRCPDGRNILDVALQTVNFSKWGILEAPQIGATIPDHLPLLIKPGVFHIITMVHTVLPHQKGCGGLEAYRVRMSGESTGLSKATNQWLDEHIHNPNPYQQARSLGQVLEKKAPQAMGLTMVIFDHVRQYMFIVGHRPPLGEWDWIKQADWNDAADNLFQHVPQLHPFTLGDDFRPIILRNHEVASRAAKMAQARGYRDGQAFNEIILNATPYPPTAYSAVRQAMGIMGYNPRPDAYFSVNTSPLPKHIESAVAQLDYAFQHYHPHTNIRVIAHTRDDLVYMGQGIAQALFYGAMSADPDWQGGIHPLVVEPPY